VEYIPVDLSKTLVGDALLSNSKFNKNLKTVYLVEGIIYYLP